MLKLLNEQIIYLKIGWPASSRLETSYSHYLSSLILKLPLQKVEDKHLLMKYNNEKIIIKPSQFFFCFQCILALLITVKNWEIWDIEVLGWCPAGSDLPHGVKVAL